MLNRFQGICDGAGAVVIASEEAVNKHNLTPLARLVGYSVAGVDPTIMGIGPVYAIRDLLQKVNLSLDNIDLVEVCGLKQNLCPLGWYNLLINFTGQ